MVAAALAVDYPGAPNGRIRGIPDTRTIRYYTTHGLLDGPVEFKGRTALYGRRHLLQLVAIKRLQARGTALTEVQSRLVGASDEELVALAEVQSAEGEGASRPEPARRREEFWAQPVATAAPAQSAVLGSQVEAVPAVSLAEGVALLLHGAERGLYPDDLEAIRVAAEPLVKLLKSRNLLGGN